MLRFKRKNDIFQPTSFILNHPQLGPVISVPDIIIRDLGLKEGDGFVWLTYHKGIIRLKLKRAKI